MGIGARFPWRSSPAPAHVAPSESSAGIGAAPRLSREGLGARQGWAAERAPSKGPGCAPGEPLAPLCAGGDRATGVFVGVRKSFAEHSNVLLREKTPQY